MPLLIIIAWLFAEAWTIAWVSDQYGGLFAFVSLLLIAFAGMALIRHQGWKALQEIQASMAREQLPAVTMLDSLIVFIAGGLLVVPGYFSDILAILLLFGGLRRSLAQQVNAHLARRHPGFDGPVTIEGHYRRVEREQLSQQRPNDDAAPRDD